MQFPALTSSTFSCLKNQKKRGKPITVVSHPRIPQISATVRNVVIMRHVMATWQIGQDLKQHCRAEPSSGRLKSGEKPFLKCFITSSARVRIT